MVVENASTGVKMPFPYKCMHLTENTPHVSVDKMSSNLADLSFLKDIPYSNIVYTTVCYW